LLGGKYYCVLGPFVINIAAYPVEGSVKTSLMRPYASPAWPNIMVSGKIISLPGVAVINCDPRPQAPKRF
jgi:hypothetical protein